MGRPYWFRRRLAALDERYLLAVPSITLCAAAFSALAFLFPRMFLWILGPHYRDLRFEVGLIILASSIRYVSGFMWVIHSARRFVYWWNNLSNIILTVAVQAPVGAGHAAA